MNTKKNITNFLLVTVLSATGTSFLLGTTVYAQETSAAASSTTEAVSEVPAVVLPEIKYDSVGNAAIGDYVVGPGKVEITVKPGETVTRYISVTNRVSDNRLFALSAEDMSGSADGSQNVVLLGDQNGPYSMKDFVTFPHQKISLNLGQRAQVPVTITMPPNAEPGGYYGAVLVETVQESKSEQSAAPQSPVVARVGTLFFITVPGAAERSAELLSFDTVNQKHWYQSGPIDLQIAYQNTGSMHLNPYGEVTVTNMLGEEVGFVQLDPWFILPKSLRMRDLSWDRELLLGRYVISVKINRGYDDVIDEASVAIWVLPWKFVLGVFAVVAVLGLLVRLFLRTFEFKRRS